MKIGVPYGVHAKNEQFALDAGRYLEEHPVEGVTPLLANVAATEADDDRRCMQENLAHSLTKPDPELLVYERRRAAELITWLGQEQFDVIIDIHSIPQYRNCYAGISMLTDYRMVKIASFMGYSNILVDAIGFPAVDPYAMTIETCVDPARGKRRELTSIRSTIRELAQYDSLNHFVDDYYAPEPLNFWLYGGAIAIPDGQSSTEVLNKDEKAYALAPFTPFTRNDARRLALQPIPATPMPPYNFLYSLDYEDIGYMGEYAYPLGSFVDDSWRLRAERMIALMEPQNT